MASLPERGQYLLLVSSGAYVARAGCTLAVARSCTVCTHRERHSIDRALKRGAAASTVAAKYAVSADALRRHKAVHLSARISGLTSASASAPSDNVVPTEPAQPSRPRSPAEEAMVAAWNAQQDDRTRRPPEFKLEGGVLKPSSSDESLWAARLAASMGGVDPYASALLLVQLDRTFWNLKQEQAINHAVALVHEIAPRDGLEAMLAVQMAAVHNVALEQLRRAQLPDQTYEGERLSMASAARLLRLFTEQMEALSRYRGKASEQRVTVEHVHVHEGGQAIVGAVSPPAARPAGAGGG